MLESSIFESGRPAKTRKPATVLVSTVAHAVAIVALVVIPLLQPHVLPILAASGGLPLPHFPQPKPDIELVEVPPGVQKEVIVTPGDLIAPESIPDDIARIVETPQPATVVLPGRPSSDLSSVFRTMVPHDEPSPEPPVEPPPPPVVAQPAPLRVGGAVQTANLIKQVAPVYPEIARRARVQGVVVLEATIAMDGTVQNLRVISGHPLLNVAAIEAVQRWLYRPTLLNGEPVEVITTVTVSFTLGG